MSAPRARAELPPWDFGYAPLPIGGSEDPAAPLDAVIALAAAAAPEALRRALRRAAPHATVEPLIERAPIYWYRVCAGAPADRAGIEAALAGAGLPLRYVASTLRPSLDVAPPLAEAARGRAVARPAAWRVRRARRSGPAGPLDRGSGLLAATDPETPGRWFLRAEEGGLGLDRGRFGAGAGTRLAVIDDDAASIDQVELEREVLVLVDRAPQGNPHGALMVAWAVGSGRRPGDFRGVAPDASPRLYLIPKPGTSALALPLAMVRAVLDGADVILCATYVEGCTSPMLDDALELAWRWGRGGRGAPVVLPTGREASSPAGSLHASFSLGFGAPASDPRVFCVGPSARGEGWFLWRDRRGRSRPFANRGPAVRWLAPGDDMAFPLRPRTAASAQGPVSERLYHAESSGASALAAGALLLVLAQNPALRVEELDAIVTWTLSPVAPGVPPEAAPLADPSDLLPLARDADGHNAKHGYGRIHAARACLAAADPVALALVLMGEAGAAGSWLDRRRAGPVAQSLYSRRFARWAVRALLADASLLHGVRALLRHARLIAGRPERRRAHGSGAMLRQLALLLRRLAMSRLAPRKGPRIAAELAALRRRAELTLRAPPDHIESAEAAMAAALAGQ